MTWPQDRARHREREIPRPQATNPAVNAMRNSRKGIKSCLIRYTSSMRKAAPNKSSRRQRKRESRQRVPSGAGVSLQAELARAANPEPQQERNKQDKRRHLRHTTEITIKWKIHGLVQASSKSAVPTRRQEAQPRRDKERFSPAPAPQRENVVEPLVSTAPLFPHVETDLLIAAEKRHLWHPFTQMKAWCAPEHEPARARRGRGRNPPGQSMVANISTEIPPFGRTSMVTAIPRSMPPSNPTR